MRARKNGCSVCNHQQPGYQPQQVKASKVDSGGIIYIAAPIAKPFLLPFQKGKSK